MAENLIENVGTKSSDCYQTFMTKDQTYFIFTVK